MEKLLIFSMFLFSFNSFGQFGFKGGPLMSNMNGQIPQLGYSGGVFYNFEIKGNSNFQLEVLYTGKGFKFTHIESDFNSPYYGVANITNLNYLEVPILYKYQLKNVVMPYVVLGFSPAYHRRKQKYNPLAGIPDYFPNRYDIGIVGGAGVNLRVGESRILFEIRINKGLIKNTFFAQQSGTFNTITFFTGFMF